MNIAPPKFSALLLGSLGIAAALSVSAANQDETFWRQLQRTDGVAPEQTQPLPQHVGSVAAQAAPTDEWIVGQLKKSDGPESQPQPPRSSRVGDRPVVRDKT